eukprot:6171849-Pleurochrysis_carterae.AAC.2
MGLTPAHDGVIPVNRNHADSVGCARDGRSAATSVDDFSSELGSHVACHGSPLALAHTILSWHVWRYRADPDAALQQEFSDMFRRQVARIVSVHASHGDMVGVAKGEVMLDGTEGVRLTGEKVRRIQVRVVVVEVDDVLLSPVYVWYAHVVDVIADDVACYFRRWRMCRGVCRVAVCPQAFVACDVACNAGPFCWCVSRALWEKAQDLRASMIESGMQQFCIHLSSLGRLTISIWHNRWRCRGANACGGNAQYARVDQSYSIRSARQCEYRVSSRASDMYSYVCLLCQAAQADQVVKGVIQD